MFNVYICTLNIRSCLFFSQYLQCDIVLPTMPKMSVYEWVYMIECLLLFFFLDSWNAQDLVSSEVRRATSAPL